MGALSISGQMGVGLAPRHSGTPTPSPSFSVQPSITGTPQVGVSFVGTPGTASNTTSHSYRWLLATTSGGTYTAISGATSASYTPVSGDETKYLKFEDTATGPGGSTVATTTFAGPVAAAAGLSAKTLTIGDSWYGSANPPYSGFYMGSYFASHTSHKVLNLAKGGTGLEWWDTKRAEIAAAKPFVIIVSFGRNDFMTAAWGGTDDATKLAAYKAKYLSCINNTAADVSGIAIICETLTEQHGSPDTSYHTSYNANRHAFNTWLFGLKTAGTIAEVIDIGSESHIGADGAMLAGSAMTADGTHLTEATGHPYALTVFQPTMDAFYTAHATPTAAIIAAPTLANLSSGWTAGDNPPAWQSTYPNAEGYSAIDGTGSSARARYSLGASGWITTGWEGLDAEMMDGAGVPWAFLTDGSLNAGGAFIVQEQLAHDLGLPTEELSDWSTSWTDTVAAAAAPAWIFNAAPAVFNVGFSAADPVDFTGEMFGAGTAIVAVAYQTNAPASVQFGGVSMGTAFHSVTAGTDGLLWFKKTGVSAGAHTITVTPSGPNTRIYGIATGTLSAAINPVPTDTKTNAIGFGADPQTSPSFTLPAGGAALCLVGPYSGGGAATWGLGTPNGSGVGPNSFGFATGSLLGGGSSSTAHFEASSFGFSGAGMAVVVFGP